MQRLEDLRNLIPDFARDIRLNLGSLLGDGGSPDLSVEQRWGTALAAAVVARNPLLTQTIDDIAAYTIDETVAEAARTAAAIMAMTNVYYRAIHMAGIPDLAARPAGLRMQGLSRHGVDQGSFELFGLAASVVKGCESCTGAHAIGAQKHGMPVAAIQATIRIASVIHAAAVVLEFPDTTLTLSRPDGALASSQPLNQESAN